MANVVLVSHTKMVSPRVLIFPERRRRALIKGIFMQANQAEVNLVLLENTLLQMENPPVTEYLLEVLRQEASTQAELQLAVMTLIRLGNVAREGVLRFILEAKGERQAWVADFLAHQFGFKRAS